MNKVESVVNRKKYPTPELLQKAIDSYFVEKDEQKKPYTFAGLARHLGMARMVLYRYHNRDGYHDIVEHARQRILESLEEKALMGKHNPTVSIFLFKNYGYSDRQEIENYNYDLSEERKKELDALIEDEN